MPAPTPRRRLPAEARREQLLDAALSLAAGRDVAVVSVEDIAGRAGVSEGLLYHYFPTKQALVAAAVTRAAEALIEDLRSHTATGDTRERLEASLDAYLGHVRAQPTGWRALLAARGGELRDLAMEFERRSQALTLDLLGVREPSPAVSIALAGWAALERDACLAWLDQPDVTAESMKALLLATFTAALTAAAEHDGQAREVLARLARQS